MKWDEFSSLLCGLMPDTPLGNVVSIRSETDREVISKYNSAQRKIYNEWQHKNMEQNEEMYKASMRQLFEMALK